MVPESAAAVRPAPPLPRTSLPTPALVIDLAALDRNIAAMAEWARGAGIALRPHAKTHKSGEIARRQIEAGAVGICCAKIGEAEALAADGIGDILITSPVVPAQAVERLARLNRSGIRLAVVADHPDNVDRIAAAVGKDGIDMLVDIDPGSHRTGVTSPEAAVALARKIVSHGLRYRGVQYYCGMLQHMISADERRAALADRARYLRTVLDALAAAGLPAGTVTGGGTGSFFFDAEQGVLNELQVGSYLFMDRQYRDVEPAGPVFEQALQIDTRVVSVNTPGHVTIDAGLKSMATEAGPPTMIAGADPATAIRLVGDEHGRLTTPEGGQDPSLDQRVTLAPPHCDPTVNLYDRYAVCDGEDVVAFWPVTARGRSS